jgi:hypothetical protein
MHVMKEKHNLTEPWMSLAELSSKNSTVMPDSNAILVSCENKQLLDDVSTCKSITHSLRRGAMTETQCCIAHYSIIRMLQEFE